MDGPWEGALASSEFGGSEKRIEREIAHPETKTSDFYLAHVIEQPNFRIPNPQYFVYLLDQTVGRDTLQFIYWNHATFSNSF